jgi:hypothetical protein
MTWRFSLRDLYTHLDVPGLDHLSAPFSMEEISRALFAMDMNVRDFSIQPIKKVGWDTQTIENLE